MEDRILFLGTGGDIIIVGKQVLGAGGIILDVEGMQFHIDPGPGALTAAKQYDINLRENTAVFVSHNHLNHCNDINAVIGAMTHSGMDIKGVVVTNKTVFNGTEEMLPVLTNFHKQCLERSIAMDAGQKLGINNVEVRAIPAKHTDPNSIGFKFFTPKLILTYTSDTGYDEDLIQHYKDSDVIILNVLNPKGVKNEFQLSTDDAIKILEAVKPKLAIITHFGVKMIKADVINEAREIQKSTGVQTIAAKDGMVVNPLTYSTSVKRKI